MSDSPSFQPQICPYCGALTRPRTSECWLCGVKIRPDWPTLEPGQVPSDPVRAARPGQTGSRSEPRPFQFGLSTLLLIMTLFAVLCSIWRMAPGLGILLTVGTCLGLLGLTGSSIRAARRGERLTTAEKLVAFFRPVLIVSMVLFVIGLVAFIGLWMICSGMRFG